MILVRQITNTTDTNEIKTVSNILSSVGLIVLIAYSFILFSLKNLATSLAFSICSILVVRLITLNCVFNFLYILINKHKDIKIISY